MKCTSCKGSGRGPRGLYSPRSPICLHCSGSGNISCGFCGADMIDDGVHAPHCPHVSQLRLAGTTINDDPIDCTAEENE